MNSQCSRPDKQTSATYINIFGALLQARRKDEQNGTPAMSASTGPYYCPNHGGWHLGRNPKHIERNAAKLYDRMAKHYTPEVEALLRRNFQ